MCPVTEPTATVEGRRVLEELAAPGRAAVLVAVDGRAVAVIALADAPRDTPAGPRGVITTSPTTTTPEGNPTENEHVQ